MPPPCKNQGDQRDRLAAVLGVVWAKGETGRRLRSSWEETRKDEASYICDSCGEEIVLPIGLTAGSRQEYVEDCPACCRPNVIHVEVDEDGDVRVRAERE